MEALTELYDQALLGILQHVGGVDEFLRVLFGFLYRKTDFYRLLLRPGDRLGFPPGAAQAMALQAFQVFERMARQDDERRHRELEAKLRKKEEEEEAAERVRVAPPGPMCPQAHEEEEEEEEEGSACPAATCRRPERPPQRGDGRPLRSASGPSVGLLPVVLKDSALVRRVRGRSCLVEELRPEADEGGCSQPGIQSRFLERHRHGGQRVLKACSDQARIRAESLQTRRRGSRRRRRDVSLLPETSGCAEARVCHPDPRCRGGIRRLACCSVEGARDGADRQGAGRKTAAASSSAPNLIKPLGFYVILRERLGDWPPPPQGPLIPCALTESAVAPGRVLGADRSTPKRFSLLVGPRLSSGRVWVRFPALREVLEERQEQFQTNPDSYNGAVRENYAWSQDYSDLEIKVPVPKHIVKGKQVSVDISSGAIRVAVLEGSSQRVLMEGKLTHKINTESSLWSLEPGKCVLINLNKGDEYWWNAILEGEEQIDIDKINKERSMATVDEEEHAVLDRLTFDYHQKLQGKPQSHELKVHEMLKKGWDTEGSPFRGQKFDPSMFNISPGAVQF
nr:nudC domain-containing protein 3 [Anser cygnoides]